MQRICHFLDRAENLTLVWTILALAFIGFIQVIARYVFNYSFTWYEELGRYLGVFIAFLGAAIGVKTGSHFTMDLIVSKMRQPFQGLTRILTHTLCGLFFFVVAWTSWKIVARMYGYGTTSPTMQIPMYVAYLPIPIFSVIIGIRFLIKGAGFIKETRGDEGQVRP